MFNGQSSGQQSRFSLRNLEGASHECSGSSSQSTLLYNTPATSASRRTAHDAGLNVETETQNKRLRTISIQGSDEGHWVESSSNVSFDDWNSQLSEHLKLRNSGLLLWPLGRSYHTLSLCSCSEPRRFVRYLFLYVTLTCLIP